jgi:alkylated DNA repair dioxygenase AlkB
MAKSHGMSCRNHPMADRNRTPVRPGYAGSEDDGLVRRCCYTYSGIRHRAAPFPAVVQRLRERAEVISGVSYNAVLLNLYRDGSDSVGWHSDYEAGLGDCPTIASLSLGATRCFQFRHRRTKETITLELSEALWLVMAGETQRFWVHQVPKTTAAVERRINLTLRRMIPVHQPRQTPQWS